MMQNPKPFALPLRIPENLIRIEDRLKPVNVFDTRFLFRCRLKVLVVTDSGSGGFNDTSSLQLGQLLNLLNDDPWSHIQIDVTKAHRDSSMQADVLDNFRFDNHNLNQYSQIWMFGIHRENAGTPLSDSELKNVCQFMDAGGGVFATGDHEDLGNSMCAKIPRVRSMRRWWHPNPGPQGEPVAPDQTGSGRHDTLVNGGDQMDPFPQNIFPKWYTKAIGPGLIKRVIRYPHPLLCGPTGPINYLPDHMHEGNCEVPADLSNTFDFDGENFIEYPSRGGHQQKPEIIATATNNVSSSQFGVIGAYDGHAVGVGRVAVDATWHHWFNVNITPYVNATDPMHATFTPDTVPKWNEIKAYFHNMAAWLAKPSLQTCIRNGGWIRTLGDTDIRITIRDLSNVKDRSKYFWQLGSFAKDSLGRGASQCQLLRWIFDTFAELDIPFQFDPFRQELPDIKFRETPLGIDFDEFETVILGAAIHGVMKEFGEIDDPEMLLEDEGEKFSRIFLSSAKQGASAFDSSMKESDKAMKTMMKALQ